VPFINNKKLTMETSIKTVYKAETRGHANLGWLNAKYSFSFANFHNPNRIHFGALRVLNDDIIEGGKGFGSHPHDNMEIVTIPLRGALQHRDNTGRAEIIRSGDVQIMSAGSGIVHSEANASPTEEINLLQLWVFPKLRNITPRYDQKTFDVSTRNNKFQVVVSPIESEESIWINQDAWFSLGNVEASKTIEYKRNLDGNGMYIFVIEGDVTIEGENLNRRDAIGILGTDKVTFTASTATQILVVEVPMKFE
jgi:redox-sensitive bicupin YhaK (pirin superfamily)